MILPWLLASCHENPGDTGLPPPICREPASTLAFTDSTAELGLSGVRGGRLSAADLDGDGYPDLVVSEIAVHARDDPEAGLRYHWLLWNRPGPDGGRVFTDGSEASGLFATRDGGFGHASQIHVFGDVDGDGDLDVFAGVFTDRTRDDDPGDRSEIFLNDGDGTFTAAPPSVLQQEKGYALSGAAFTDYDGDGVLDLWLTGWYQRYGESLVSEQDRLYRGLGDGTFTEVTGEAGLSLDRTTTSGWLDDTARLPAYGATACDLTGDGLPELLASNYARAFDQLWRNDGGSFTEAGRESGYASDGELDYSDNQYYRCWCEVHGCEPDPGPASLSPCDTYASYWNPGFDDQPGRLGGNSFTTACGDVDADGDMDLLTAEIAHWHIGASSDPTELLLNDGGGTFSRPGLEATGMERSWPSASWNAGDLVAAFADMDDDGRQDIVLVSSDYPDDRLFLWRQAGDLEFEEVAEDAGVAHPWPAGLALADFDRDGDLDLVTGSSTARSGTPWQEHEVHYYQNLSGGNAARILLRAHGTATGARVRVTAGGRTQLFEVSGGYGHFGVQNGVAVHVGLGGACEYDVEVDWPGGGTDSWTGVLANYEVLLRQGGGVRYRSASD